MIKDSKKFPETGGWGFGHWEGKTLVMNDKGKSATCFACNTPMKDHDNFILSKLFRYGSQALRLITSRKVIYKAVST